MPDDKCVKLADRSGKTLPLPRALCDNLLLTQARPVFFSLFAH